MNLEYDEYHQHILDQITQQLEILIMDILLASINQIKSDYENAALKPNHKTDNIDF
ncbi:MAG: hypothetical protein AB1Z31_34450 [Desulfobacterales bacterium]|jgi:hypothetical protein